MYFIEQLHQWFRGLNIFSSMYTYVGVNMDNGANINTKLPHDMNAVCVDCNSSVKVFYSKQKYGTLYTFLNMENKVHLK